MRLLPLVRRFLPVFAGTVGFAALPALAGPTIEENWETYPVDGTTIEEILAQMAERGPEGYWGHAKWHVRWTGSCEVRLRIDYRMPRHVNPELLDERVRGSWEGMIEALGRHERQHGAHGVGAAEELVGKACRDGKAIVEKWVEQDRAYDRETDHGRFEGVVFPDAAAMEGPLVSGGGVTGAARRAE